MAAKVIHFGQDDCHRLMVLRSAGYSVDDCGSLVQLRTRLATGMAADALLVSDDGGPPPDEAIALAKTRTTMPVILFRSTNLAYEESGIDLVVPCLTPPEIWLNEVGELIQKSRIPRASQAAQLRRESQDARERSRSERVRSKRVWARNPEFSPQQPFCPKPGLK